MLKEKLGPIIHSSFGQGAVILQGKDTPTVCFVGNGAPTVFYEFNLFTGEKLFEQKLLSGDCVWGICKTAENEVYLTNTEDSILYRYSDRELVNLGTNPSNPFVFSLDQDSQFVWGGTYPKSKVFSFNKQTNEFIDHGTMFEGEDYVRSLTSHDGWVYMGSGSTKYLKRMNTQTKEIESLHLDGVSGENGFLDRIFLTDEHLLISADFNQLHIYKRDSLQKIDQLSFDNLIHTKHPVQPELYLFKDGRNLCAWNAQTGQSTILLEKSLPNGRLKAIEWIVESGEYFLAMVTVNAELAIVRLQDFSVKTSTLKIEPQPIINTVFQVSPDGKLYAGGYQRGFSIYNIEKNEVEECIGLFPQGEGIAFHGDDVYYGTYTHAHLFRYRPSEPVSFDWSKDGNPAWIGQIDYHQDRPFAMVSGDKYVFFGTVPDYGLQGGALAVWDTELETLVSYPQIVQNQSIVGLTYKDGLLFGSTGVWGGLGKPPVEGPAKMFVWDVQSRQKIAEFVPEIPNMDHEILFIGNLTVGPDGLIWGLIDGTIFAIDPVTYKTVKSKIIYPTSYSHSKWRPLSIAFGTDGLIYTNLGNKLTIVHPDTLEFKKVNDDTISHMTIDKANRIYYCIGTDTIRITLDTPVFS